MAVVKIVFEAEDKASGAIGGIKSALGGVGTVAGGVLAATGLERLGSMATDAARGAVDMAADYRGSMKVLQAALGASDETMAQLDAKARELGNDMSLPGVSAKSAADAMIAMVNAGVSLDNVLAGIKDSLRMSAAGGLENADAARMAASALNMFKMNGDQAGRVADVFAGNIAASGQQMGVFMDALRMGGTSFASAGRDLGEFATATNIMAKAGLVGSDAGTSLKTMMQRLAAPTKDARSLMDGLGISVFDAEGKMRPLRDLVGQFSEKMSGLTDEQRMKAIEKIFGADAMRAANIVLTQGVDAYDQMALKVDRTGVAADLASARMTGLKGALGGLQNTIETELLGLGDVVQAPLASLATSAAGFVPAITGPIRDGLTALVADIQNKGLRATLQGALGLDDATMAQAERMGGLVVRLAQTVGTELVNGAKAARDAVGPLAAVVLPRLNDLLEFAINHSDGLRTVLVALGAVVVGAKVVGAIMGLVAAVQGVLGVLGSLSALAPVVGGALAVLGGPVTLLIGGVALLGAAWATNFMGIRDRTAEAGAFVGEQVGRLSYWLTNTVPDAARGAGDAMRNWASDLRDRAAGAADGVRTALDGGLRNAADWVSGALVNVRNAFDWYVRDPVERAEGVLRGLVNGIYALANPMTWLGDWLNWLRDRWQDFTSAVPYWLIPHSPPPFAVGLGMVADQMGRVARGADTLTDAFTPMRLAPAVAGASGPATITVSITTGPIQSDVDVERLAYRVAEVIDYARR